MDIGADTPERPVILLPGVSPTRLPTTLHRWLYLLAMLMLIAGLVMFGLGTSAVHEIEALICVLIAAVCFVGGAVVDVIQRAWVKRQK